MATTKRNHRHSAGQPTINVRAERVAQSLADEQATLRRRRTLMIGVPGLILALVLSGVLYSRASQPTNSSSPLAAAPTALPAVQATAVPAPQTVATAAPGMVIAQPGVPIDTGSACAVIAGLPVYANATCVEHESDQDDGVTKNEDTYVTTATADDVRRFYEGAFAQSGWTVEEFKHDAQDNDWSYSITQAQRRLKIEIEPAQEANGSVTRITIAEK